MKSPSPTLLRLISSRNHGMRPWIIPERKMTRDMGRRRFKEVKLSNSAAGIVAKDPIEPI